MAKLDELMAQVVDRLAEAIETAGDWHKPWQALATGTHRNVETDRAYTGINSLILWVEEMLGGLADPRWGTYKTWQRVGAQVQGGQRGTRLVFWASRYHCGDCDATFGEDHDAAVEHRNQRKHEVYNHPVLRWFTVFNAAQVDDAPPYEVEAVPDLEVQHAVAARFVEATGVVVKDHPTRAFFRHSDPEAINVPKLGQFDSEPAYWGTVFHELTHWSGHESRLARQGRNAYGSEDYALEELVAELGSAFLSTHLRVVTEPHPESAAYLRSWLAAVKEKPSALYHASKAATEAVRYLSDLADDDEVAA